MTQFVSVPGVIDLAWGHPDPAFLPVHDIERATASALRRFGPDMLAYGNPAGPPALIEFIQARLSETDGRVPEFGEVVVSAGISHALDLLTTLLAAPGDCVLIEVPTYHLAVRILADHPVRLIPIPSDEQGVLPEALRDAVAHLRREGASARLVYTIPTFHNPTGRLMPLERRREVVAVAAELDLTLLEDDTYRELAYDAPPLPSLWSLAPPGVVIRLASFSKSAAPGLRVGYVTADYAISRRLVESGPLDSGGGPAHFAASVMAEYAASGALLAQMKRVIAQLAQRRDALTSALSHDLPRDVTWSTPGGGYFVWVKLPAQVSDERLMAASAAHRVGFVAESVFGVDSPPTSSAVRLSFSLYGEAELETASERLARVLGDVLS